MPLSGRAAMVPVLPRERTVRLGKGPKHYIPSSEDDSPLGEGGGKEKGDGVWPTPGRRLADGFFWVLMYVAAFSYVAVGGRLVALRTACTYTSDFNGMPNATSGFESMPSATSGFEGMLSGRGGFDDVPSGAYGFYAVPSGAYGGAVDDTCAAVRRLALFSLAVALLMSVGALAVWPLALHARIGLVDSVFWLQLYVATFLAVDFATHVFVLYNMCFPGLSSAQLLPRHPAMGPGSTGGGGGVRGCVEGAGAAERDQALYSLAVVVVFGLGAASTWAFTDYDCDCGAGRSGRPARESPTGTRPADHSRRLR